MGNLVKGKDPEARAWIARRTKALAAEVLCLQEVEDQDALDAFNRDDLVPVAADYPYELAPARCTRCPHRSLTRTR